ncbi:hypothetical protein HG531_000704 [Fusarium graminearum]|nr:hypothetical protein HG531_000704 [Fusarium graminearum]
MTDPKVTKAFEDGRVPKGITADYLNQSRDASAIAGIVFVTALTSIIVLGRLASRAFLMRRFGFDDGLTLISWMCFVAFVGLCIELIKLGSGRHFAYIEYVLDMPTIEYTEVLDFVAHIIYTTALLLCRMSGLAFYHRLCAIHDRLRLGISVVFGILIAGYIPQLLLIVFHCTPVTGLWPIQRQLISVAYMRLFVVRYPDRDASGVGDAKEEKDTAGMHFATWYLCVSVIAISIVRLVLVIEGQWNTDMSWAYDPMLAIEVSEIGATLIALSIPGFKPLFDKVVLQRDITKGESNVKSKYEKQQSSKGGTALRSLNFRPEHDALTSRDTSAARTQVHRTSNATADNRSENSADGILVQVDFRIKEDIQDANSTSDPERAWQ